MRSPGGRARGKGRERGRGIEREREGETVGRNFILLIEFLEYKRHFY